mgnify:CR=1 FL=1
MRRFIGPLIIALMLLFGLDVCSSATDRQKSAFVGAVERTTTYEIVESVVPDEWFQAWTDSWRERMAPHLMDEDGGGG